MTYGSIRTARKSEHWKTRQANARHAEYARRARKAWRTKRDGRA